ncbi:MAG TPA: hypothetical protein VFC74_01490 [Oscillospiraceae bacterium]|nr:hypothetical protein [Oscillospiraceae bacterium]
MADTAKEVKEIRLIECESLIKRIRDVLSVNIVLGEQSEIVEVHVLAEAGRNAKQIVRDIETLLQVEYGIDLDHKKVSIVQLNQGQKLAHEKRLNFTGISYSLQGSQLEAVVELAADKRTCQGRSSGVNTRRNGIRLFAQATTEAIKQFLAPGATLIFEDVAQFSLGSQTIIATTLTLLHDISEETLVGSALIRHDDKDAVVRATLAAINRRVPLEL